MSDLVSFFRNLDLRFVFFGGKGGVGKTTSAAASALYLARQRPDRKVLIVSTDPAHSVGDSFAQTVGDEPVPIIGVDNLWARELDTEKILAEYRHINNPIMAEIANRGTLFDEEDIANFMQLTLPGMDEVMAIRELIRLIKTGEYDLVVVDTAPTGHTVRMLGLPGEMRNWTKTLDMMMDKHRYMVRIFTGRYVPDECDRFLKEQKADVTLVERMLKNVETTEFVLVTIPEEMAVRETKRLFSTLKREHIPVRNLIINHVIAREGLCVACLRRQAEQAEPLTEIRAMFSPGLHLCPVPRMPYEVRGVEGLAAFAQYIVGGGTARRDETTAAGNITAPHQFHKRADEPKGNLPAGEPHGKDWNVDAGLGMSLPSAGFILVGGKGGVGKTGVAAATAIRLARRSPEKKVLLFSTNPAHSASDSLGQKVGSQITPLDGFANLYAQEIDAPRLLQEFMETQRDAIDEVASGFIGGGSARVAFEREIMDQLLTTTPAGMDELMALMEVMELVDAGTFDIFVLDGAATGHLILFLEMPHLAREWFATSARILLKYRGVVRLGATAELTIEYSRQTRRVLQQFSDAASTEFIVVTIPEAMGIAEGGRLLQSLERLQVPCRQVLINFVTPLRDCPFCRPKREEEQHYIRQMTLRYPNHRVAQMPRLDHEIRGIEDLTRLGERIFR